MCGEGGCSVDKGLGEVSSGIRSTEPGTAKRSIWIQTGKHLLCL